MLWPGGRRELALKSKSELARELVALIAERYREARRPLAKLSPVSG